MNKRKHLSIDEREIIYGLLQRGKSRNEIARRLSRPAKTVRSELTRNCKYGRAYSPSRAQVRADRVGKRQRQKAPLKNPLVYVYTRQKLRKKWSPETIAGRLLIDHPDESITHETIYRYIYSTPARRRQFVPLLRQSHHRRRLKPLGRAVKVSKIADATPITKRPVVIANRTSLGHWESDLIEGPIK